MMVSRSSPSRNKPNKDRPGRGRFGKKRYKHIRVSTITFGDFQDLIEKIDTIEKIDINFFKSLIAFLYYLGLRIAEIVGDGKRKWKKLTKKGEVLSKMKELREDWMETEEGDLWYWKYRDPLPGIIKKDITLEGNILRIYSKPLKHGKREAPGGGEGPGELELDIRYPYVDLIVEQWEKTEPGEKVWDTTTWKAWNFISKISDEELYPHAFRISKATVMARNPEMAIADLMQWFGWARAATADKYIMTVRSVTKTRVAMIKEIPPELLPPELRPKVEQ